MTPSTLKLVHFAIHAATGLNFFYKSMKVVPHLCPGNNRKKREIPADGEGNDNKEKPGEEERPDAQSSGVVSKSALVCLRRLTK